MAAFFWNSVGNAITDGGMQPAVQPDKKPTAYNSFQQSITSIPGKNSITMSEIKPFPMYIQRNIIEIYFCGECLAHEIQRPVIMVASDKMNFNTLVF